MAAPAKLGEVDLTLKVENLPPRLDSETELRLLSLSDAGDLSGLIEQNRHHIGQWLRTVGQIQNIEQATRYIETWRNRLAAGEAIPLAIWHQERFAGEVSLSRINFREKSAHIRYYLDQSLQGRGLISRSCRALISHGFAALQLNRIVIRCAVENGKSRAIPERLGFTQEGILREDQLINGQFLDVVCYGLLAREWAQ